MVGGKEQHAYIYIYTHTERSQSLPSESRLYISWYVSGYLDENCCDGHINYSQHPKRALLTWVLQK